MPDRLSRLGTVFVAAAVMLATGAVTADASTGRGSSSSYRLSYNSDHTVVRWNPCATIHYRLNNTHAPRGAAGDVATAIAAVSRATGLRFHYDGLTHVIPQVNYGASYRAGAVSAPPLVIAWAAPGYGSGRSDLLSGSSTEAGVGGWSSVWWSDGTAVHLPRIFTGYVVLNTRFNYLPGGFGAGPTRGELLLHELGHAVGLQHAGSRSQIMYPVLGRYSTYGAGDLAGLRRVGRAAGCLT